MEAPVSAELFATVPAWDFHSHGNKYIRESDIAVDRDAGAWLTGSMQLGERLAARGIEALELRGLGAHIIAPRKVS